MKAHTVPRTRIAGLFATLAVLLYLGTATSVCAADRTVIGELWSADN